MNDPLAAREYRRQQRRELGFGHGGDMPPAQVPERMRTLYPGREVGERTTDGRWVWTDKTYNGVPGWLPTWQGLVKDALLCVAAVVAVLAVCALVVWGVVAWVEPTEEEATVFLVACLVGMLCAR